MPGSDWCTWCGREVRAKQTPPATKPSLGGGARASHSEQSSAGGLPPGKQLRYDTSVVDLAYEGDVAGVRSLVSRGVSPESRDAKGRTALSAASFMGHYDVVCELIGCGADLNARDEDLNTPLILAIMDGHARVVELLLECGADPKLASVFRRTPLMWAAHYGDIESVRSLLRHGANVNQVTGEGIETMTALLSAQHAHKDAVARILKEAGAKEVVFQLRDSGAAPRPATATDDSCALCHKPIAACGWNRIEVHCFMCGFRGFVHKTCVVSTATAYDHVRIASCPHCGGDF